MAIQEESIYRVRPPRVIYSDRIVKPFRFREAKSMSILKGVEKGFYAKYQFVASLDADHDGNLILIATDR